MTMRSDFEAHDQNKLFTDVPLLVTQYFEKGQRSVCVRGLSILETTIQILLFLTNKHQILWDKTGKEKKIKIND